MGTFFEWMKKARTPPYPRAGAAGSGRILPIVIDNATGAVVRADLPRFARRHSERDSVK
ncbi:MAG: hypothetical protein PHX68_04650 [Alphaproteobacteria bacterium]|nr:hypothetical protein [Alphaproteobacteria bacterium]